MSAPGTIRERVERAVDWFHVVDAVVLTTFNFDPAFVEEHVLPTVLGVEGSTAAAKRAGLHARLGEVPCAVYYDPSTRPKTSGRYRYVARPVPIRNRYFHPKLIIIAGEDDEGTGWVYVAVTSANLSMSGWGRNVESFGETWIHTQKQQSHGALEAFTTWLQGYTARGERGKRVDAMARVRERLAQLPNRRRFTDDPECPWSGTLRARLYFSVVHDAGLADFLQQGRSRRATELWAASPYWADVPQRMVAFNARCTVLLPALRPRDQRLALSRGQHADLLEAMRKRGGDELAVLRNADDGGDRFWHMKAYFIAYDGVAYTAVGSCNFTRAGLVGAGGNVEAMLVMKGEPDWFPDGEAVDPDNLASEGESEEGAPEPSPVAICVAWDWADERWRWWIDPGPDQHDFVLELPELAPIETEGGVHEQVGPPPPRAATFTVAYREGDRRHRWQGVVVEIGLDHSTRTYGRPLTASEILESWRSQARIEPGGEGAVRGEEGSEEGDDDEQTLDEAAAFDVGNLYDLYRSMRALRARLHELEERPDLQRGLLVAGPASAMKVVRQAERARGPAPVRFLVLRELGSVLRSWHSVVGDRKLVTRTREVTARLRAEVLAGLETELGRDAGRAEEMLRWFERQLARPDRIRGAAKETSP
ncbi:hypothetical protein ENSA5_05630 [Enhygromyxa salina]|uniref:PLD phosphodiesterase domain-containing protein n=1 Tax=Enhygromyxa salina TaxID=215803 RepID=A0A2S9YHY6_9BACT|nr:hypothetical protein [Enhygromyxa salina]PRQ04689.1 hypothetical protein ENSA5_05630 [Enhygromyxa salina]